MTKLPDDACFSWVVGSRTGIEWILVIYGCTTSAIFPSNAESVLIQETERVLIDRISTGALEEMERRFGIDKTCWTIENQIALADLKGTLVMFDNHLDLHDLSHCAAVSIG